LADKQNEEILIEHGFSFPSIILSTISFTKLFLKQLELDMEIVDNVEGMEAVVLAASPP